MVRPRIIPCLLVRGGGLVKTVGFKKPIYVGDPINAVRIFNEKEVDELILLDISARAEGRRPSMKMISEIATECFMPVAYGGGITSLNDIREILSMGIEKVVLNSISVERPEFVLQAAEEFGSSTIIVSVDFHRTLMGKYEAYGKNGGLKVKVDAFTWCTQMAQSGAGELFLNSIDRDGSMKGYDLHFVESVCRSVEIPVVACGGAGSLNHFSEVLRVGASAAAAGSFFVFQGPHRAVLISYPSRAEMAKLVQAAGSRTN